MLQDSYGIFSGRFQPFHVGHVQFINDVLENLSKKVIIAIITQPTIPPKVKETDFRKTATEQLRPSRNPFTYWERHLMIKGSIGLYYEDLDIQIIPLPRPDFFWHIGRDFLPSSRFWVIPNVSDFDRAKVPFFQGLGEKVQLLEAKFRAISATEIRDRILRREEWEDLVPPPVAAIMKTIDLTARLATP